MYPKLLFKELISSLLLISLFIHVLFHLLLPASDFGAKSNIKLEYSGNLCDITHLLWLLLCCHTRMLFRFIWDYYGIVTSLLSGQVFFSSFKTWITLKSLMVRW